MFFGEFNSEKLAFMDSTFENCSSLKYLDLSLFNATNLKSMAKTFKNINENAYIFINENLSEKINNMSNINIININKNCSINFPNCEKCNDTNIYLCDDCKEGYICQKDKNPDTSLPSDESSTKNSL